MVDIGYLQGEENNIPYQVNPEKKNRYYRNRSINNGYPYYRVRNIDKYVLCDFPENGSHERTEEGAWKADPDRWQEGDHE